jgi:DNA-binding transcriptional LysR family regulator
MELRQLEYFAAVARHGGFTRAADALWITQPALSQQVRRLEAELGVALLRRTSRGAELTPAGEELLAHAEAALGELARAREAVARHAGGVVGRVRVAATTVDALRLPAALAAFHREHPGLQVALRHAAAGELPALVAAGVVDVAVTGVYDDGGGGGGAGAPALLGVLPSGVALEALGDEPMRALMPPGDPLAGGEPVSLGALAERPLILAEPGSGLREAVVAACQRAGFSPVPLFEVSDPATVRHLVHAELGCSVVPASWLAVPGPEAAAAALAGRAPRHGAGLLTAPAARTAAGDLLVAALRDALAVA